MCGDVQVNVFRGMYECRVRGRSRTRREAVKEGKRKTYIQFKIEDATLHAGSGPPRNVVPEEDNFLER